MSGNKAIAASLLPVRAACHASVTLDVASPPGAKVIIEHLHDSKLLARECRPLAIRDNCVRLKTHPHASQIRCRLQIGDRLIDGVRFEVDCDRSFDPTSRNFIVIGAMKAGTTTLFELLAQHPAICRTWVEVPGMSSTKEINYFRRLYRRDDTALHYDWRFPFDPARHAWTLDVSPSYATWPASRAVPARIASLGGKTKIAYILREPVDRIESHLAHKLHRTGKTPGIEQCIRTSCYAMQLDRFTPHVNRDDILLLDFEQFRRRPAVLLAQVCDFLGIERLAGHSAIHNKRNAPFRLSARQRAGLADAMRPDVQRLISAYGFKPAERWLRRPVLSRIRLSAFRR